MMENLKEVSHSQNLSHKSGPKQKAVEAEKKSLKWLRDKYREPVKGIFRFYEVPGGFMEFCYREFREDQVEKFAMHDGEIYTIPLGVAKHLNKNGWYPIHAYAKDADGETNMKISQKVRRFGFQSLEFVDIEDLTPTGSPIITVERI